MFSDGRDVATYVVSVYVFGWHCGGEGDDLVVPAIVNCDGMSWSPEDVECVGVCAAPSLLCVAHDGRFVGMVSFDGMLVWLDSSHG